MDAAPTANGQHPGAESPSKSQDGNRAEASQEPEAKIESKSNHSCQLTAKLEPPQEIGVSGVDQRSDMVEAAPTVAPVQESLTFTAGQNSPPLLSKTLTPRKRQFEPGKAPPLTHRTLKEAQWLADNLLNIASKLLMRHPVSSSHVQWQHLVPSK